MLKTIEQNLILQNKLLEKLCNSFEQQNMPTPPHESFVKDLEHDEMRNGFLVTSHRKKLWNVQIGLINEFARVCKKYNLKWFAFYGTLLGAARHKGFIPWDDDIDLVMLRPDYNKFLDVCESELTYPYFVDNWYKYQFESDGESARNEKLLWLTREQEDTPFKGAFPKKDYFKIRDSRTTMIEINNRKSINQGVWIDIFPYDPFPPFTDNQKAQNFEAEREMLMAIHRTDIIKDALQNNQPMLISKEYMKNFIKLPFRQRCAIYNDFAGKNFFDSSKVGLILDSLFSNYKAPVFDKKDFDEIVYLPFEQIEIPAPIGWQNCLTVRYGNWRKMIRTHSHTSEYSVDIPYDEYYKTSTFME